ncbi:hypothetical protein J7U46_20870 [Pelomonas sp. V22]|uniref:hypothetical protein n=1 Tax=Pelomonas sp. V22 TaxID=2822139 RepID=UPI0024A83CE2|nr:hypothetical protein [Pelomonas sp. V22]MDI4635529.1 hypothetical protein [Pelomonas sp. V22]
MLDIRVLLAETCPSLSHRSTLTFQFGMRADETFVLRLVANSSKGMFSNDWVTWPDVQALLVEGETLTFATLHPLFEGKSINTSGFLLAVLRHLGVVQADVETGRGYVAGNAEALMERIQALAASKVSLGLDARPGSIRGRRKLVAMEQPNAAALDS